jgi:hypothetical protein
MSPVTTDNLQREFQEKAQQVPQAEWVRDMIDHYRRTGAYRAEDLLRLLGDPNQAVEVGPKASLASFRSARLGG